MSVRTSGSPRISKLQADALLDQANPVQNTWYTVADLKGALRIRCLVAQVLTTGETVDMELTIDGRVITWTGAAYVASTGYFPILHIGSAGLYIYATNTSDLTGQTPYMIECQSSFQMRIRKTTAAGNGNLQAGVAYSRY